MSPLMFSNPARRAAEKAARACFAVWGRPSVLSWLSRADWTPNGNAVDARLPECPERVFGHGLRVGFQRDLGPGQGLRGVDEPGGVCRVQQTGRSTAEIKGVRPQGRVRRKPGEFPQKGVHIGPGDAALAGGGVKITVPAFGKTVRDMQIKSEGHQISQPFS